MAYLDNIAVFVRVVELGNLSAAGRDMRISPAVASNRIKELEKHLGVRLFNRTTRQLMPTEQGTVFYSGAKHVLEAIVEAEAAVSALSGQPRGTIQVTAPLGLGRRLIASGIPEFHDKYPEIEVRLRLSDHNVDIMKEGIDVAFRLGPARGFQPAHARHHGVRARAGGRAEIPGGTRRAAEGPDELIVDRARLPDAALPRRHASIVWTLRTPEGPQKFEVHGPFDSDDGDVLTGWALAGRGIINKPRFEVEPFIRDRRLQVILPGTPPTPVQFAAVYPHKKFQDPKVRLLLDFMAERCQRLIRDILAGK